MKQQSTEAPRSSSVQWDNLEGWVRGHVQGFIQQILERDFLKGEQTHWASGLM